MNSAPGAASDDAGSVVAGPGRPPATGVPPAPEAARAIFGEHLDLAERFTAILADTGVTHGLIGPREVPRLWERHVLNCAVVQDALSADVEVIDVGSGAGLPGLALAIVRPDLSLHLIEPMLRRTTWLTETIEALGLTNVTVHRGRAEDFWGSLRAPVVTARAVARLAELARWCLPLLEQGGTMLALKGGTAAEELMEDRAAIRRLGAVDDEILIYGTGLLDLPTTVVRVDIDQLAQPRPKDGGAGEQKRSARRDARRRQGPPRR